MTTVDQPSGPETLQAAVPASPAAPSEPKQPAKKRSPRVKKTTVEEMPLTTETAETEKQPAPKTPRTRRKTATASAASEGEPEAAPKTPRKRTSRTSKKNDLLTAEAALLAQTDASASEHTGTQTEQQPEQTEKPVKTTKPRRRKSTASDTAQAASPRADQTEQPGSEVIPVQGVLFAPAPQSSTAQPRTEKALVAEKASEPVPDTPREAVVHEAQPPRAPQTPAAPQLSALPAPTPKPALTEQRREALPKTAPTAALPQEPLAPLASTPVTTPGITAPGLTAPAAAVPAQRENMVPAEISPAPTAPAPEQIETSSSSEAAEGETAEDSQSQRRRRSRRSRSRRRSPAEKADLAALAQDSTQPDYVSDDDDDESTPAPAPADESSTPEEGTKSEQETRRRRQRRRRQGPAAVFEPHAEEPEELHEEQTFTLPTDIFEELVAGVLESAPVRPASPVQEKPLEKAAAVPPLPQVEENPAVFTSEELLPETEPFDDDGNENTEDAEYTEGTENTEERRSRNRFRRKRSGGSIERREEEPSENEEEKKKLNRRMLVSVLPGDQVEVVLTENDQVTEYYVEMSHHAKIRGNIYKGVINNIDTNLQAAFVNYGNVKNGFLQIDEVHPEYYLQPHEPMKGRKYPPMQKVLKNGQEVLVQVVKEPNGSKGAFLTTWVSLAGRFLVLTPGQEQIGISRKVEDTEERNRLRELIKGLDPGEGLGAIVRTVSAGTSKTTLQKDLNFLKRVWKDIRKKATTEKSPSLIYQEPGLATRSVRDYLSDEVSEVWVDDEATAEAIREMAALLFPRKADLVHVYTDHKKTLWEHFNVLPQLEQVHAREVIMPSGGRLVFDQTEALMAIDINSGKIGGKTNFESMAFRTNMEAARAIARQLRLRDIGGQIVIDFIEMRDPEHCREVEKEIRNAMKGDRARHDIGKMSSFGLMQIVRQRTGSSAISISMETCPYCNGTGQRRTLEWQAIQTLRKMHREIRAAAASNIDVCVQTVEAELGLYLLNHKRARMSALEQEFGVRLEIRIEGISPSAAGN